MKLAKNQANAKQHPEGESFLLEVYSHSSSTLTSKGNRAHSYIINHHENEDENGKKDRKIDLDLNVDTNLVNIKSVSVWWCLYVLSNTEATFEAQFMKKLGNTEADLKKALLLKKACICYRTC